MKKTTFFQIAIFAVIAMVSCKKSTKSNNANGEASNDTTLMHQATGEVSDNETEANCNFCTPDLQLNDLHGSVQKCYKKSASCDQNEIPKKDAWWAEETLVYDKDGWLDLTDSETNWRIENPHIKRNTQNQITKVIWHVPDFDSDIYTIYSYNKLGMLECSIDKGIESIDTITYVYDNHNNLSHSESAGYGEGSIFLSSFEYRIMEVDDNDNWTRRIVKCTYQSTLDDGTSNFDEKTIDYIVELREITYY